MADLTEFQQYYKLADRLIDGATEEDLAECARLLALNLAHYQVKYGELPLDETLAMISTAEPNDDQAVLLRDPNLDRPSCSDHVIHVGTECSA